MPEENIAAYPVLLAGGSGTRLWPVSRELFPKQLVRFFGNESLIQDTVKRLFPVFDRENVRIVCGKNHSHEICRDMHAIDVLPDGKIIDEPCGRNTGPAILLAALEILKKQNNAVIFIFPADHVIGDVSAFHDKVKTAISLALQDYIVTFGITPDYPETGYGYIEASETRIGQAFPIRRFVEKPDIKTAEKYLKAGNFFWNSGMFAFKASVIIGEFEKFHPAMLRQLQEMLSQEGAFSYENYNLIESISFDYAVMETTEKGVVLPSSFGWSDIGSWKSLYDFLPKDKNQNVITNGDVILQNTRNSFIMGHERLVAVNNLDNIVVVETPDSVFVSDMENSREVKSIVNTLKEKERKEYKIHTTVYRPWGYYKVLESSDELTVKRIVVYPESEMPGKASGEGTMQWLVVEGSAKVTLDNESLILKETESVRISEKHFHKLENSGKTELCIIQISR